MYSPFWQIWHNRPSFRCHIGGKEVYLKKVCGMDELLTELFKKWNGGTPVSSFEP